MEKKMLKKLYLSSAILTSLLTLSPQKTLANDIDCTILLCMAGGFPPHPVCIDAYKEMIRRITPWPVLPPFGICTIAGFNIDLGVSTGIYKDLDLSSLDLPWLDALAIDFAEIIVVENDDEGRVSTTLTVRRCPVTGKYKEINASGSNCPISTNIVTLGGSEGECISESHKGECNQMGNWKTPMNRINEKWYSNPENGGKPPVLVTNPYGVSRSIRVRYSDQKDQLNWTDWINY